MRKSIPGLVLLGLTMVFWAGGAPAVEKPGEKPDQPALPVKALQVAPVSQTFLRQLPAKVLTETETRLAFRVSGRILELPVTVGRVIKKGNLIARLDARDYRDSAGQAEAALAQSVARQKDAGLHLERIRKLWADQDVDISQLDNARANARAAQDQVTMQRKAFHEARRRLSYTDLTAPFTGIVADKKVNRFDTVSPGEPVVLFVDLSHLKARAQLSPSLIPERTRFEKYTILIPALKGLRLPATLLGIGPSALPQANTYPITVMVHTEPGTEIRPGMNGLLEITVRRHVNDRFIRIPLSAVSADPKGNSRVWVVDKKKGIVQNRQVELGNLTSQGIEVKKGLDTGEWVVTAGVRKLRPGQRVLILKTNP
ncbi:MAG: efflux RND transporter periplasmic adaptor subunit [Deltaproteobacteria bacterium]|nr:efflux RND transporter periplasmic adaptor subunit [Deltaproteobacteria bacterium]